MAKKEKDVPPEMLPGAPRAPSAWEITRETAQKETPVDPDSFEGEPEAHGGGPSGRDADTGMSGYAGDAVEEGALEAGDEPTRPADREIHGDPRTHEGESYPEEEKRANPRQRPIGEEARRQPPEDL